MCKCECASLCVCVCACMCEFVLGMSVAEFTANAKKSAEVEPKIRRKYWLHHQYFVLMPSLGDHCCHIPILDCCLQFLLEEGERVEVHCLVYDVTICETEH